MYSENVSTSKTDIKTHSKIISKEQLAETGSTVVESISIIAPASYIYEYCRNLTHLPEIFSELDSVTVLSDTTSRWVIKPANAPETVAWECEITEDLPGLAISWQTMHGEEIKHAATMRFTELPFGRGTLVDMKVIFAPLEEKFKLGADLKKLRELIETGEVPTTEGQPTGKLH